MIDLIAAAGIGGLTVGALVYLAMKESAAGLRGKLFHTECELEAETAITESLGQELRSANKAKSLQAGVIGSLKADRDRASDAAGGAQRKLSAIRDLLDKPRTIRKGELAAILDGDVA